VAKTLGNGTITVTLPEGIRWLEQHTPQTMLTSVLTDISGTANKAIVFNQAVSTGIKITLELGQHLRGNSLNGVLKHADMIKIIDFHNNKNQLTLVLGSVSYTCRFASAPEFTPHFEYNDATKDFYIGIIPLVTV
jgi:hypothetical protein